MEIYGYLRIVLQWRVKNVNDRNKGFVDDLGVDKASLEKCWLVVGDYLDGLGLDKMLLKKLLTCHPKIV